MLSLSPAQGGAALYLPLGGGGTGNSVKWSRDHGADLLGSGPYEGALFLRVPDGSLGMAALRQGAFLIAVPESLCGAPSPALQGPQAAPSQSMESLS